MQFSLNKGAAGADDDYIGLIRFFGDNDAQQQVEFGKIYNQIETAADGTEAGKMFLQVAVNGTLKNGINFVADSASGVIDVGIADGAASTTTIAGDLTVTSDLTVNGDNILFQSANANDPIVTIKNTSNDTNDMASLKFVKDRGAAPAAGTNLAEIYFVGEDSAQNEQEYGRMLCEIDVATDGQESGVLKLGVANHDGGNGYGLTMTGGSADNEVDTTIGLGAASVTTVAGTLTMGSTAAMTNAGLLSVAGQTNITSLGTLTNLDVDDINLNTKTITITGDTDDTFSVATGAAGATTLTTVDTAGADGHLAMVADGNITLKPADNLDVQILDDNGTAQVTISPNSNTMFQMLGRGAFFGPASAASAGVGRSTSPHDTAGGEMNIQAGNTTAGTTDNIAGGDLIIAGGQGKGSGAGGDIIFKTANAGGSGSTLNNLATAVTISDDLSTTLAGAVTSTGTLTTGGTIELGHASDTTIARSAAGVVTIEDNQIVTAGVPKGNTFHIGCPTYISLYLFYMNTQNYWYTPPMYNTLINGNTAIGSMSNLTVVTQARAANYVAPRACKVKTVSMVFKQASSYLSGDINLEFQLIKWTPNDDASGSVAVTDMAITDHAGGFTENDVHSLIFTVTDNADAALAANDCLAFCARTTSAPGSGSTVRNLVNGHINYEIEIT
jgi:hypothetical protein